MAQAFVGKWKTDLTSMKGAEEVMDAYGKIPLFSWFFFFLII